MRSWRERRGAVTAGMAGALALVPLGALALLGAGCEEDSARSQECARSGLTYQTFGEAFLVSWCRGCHSRELPEDMRQMAPLDVNFNTLDDVRARAGRVGFLVSGSQTMPPAGGPSMAERALMMEWLSCGAPE